VLVVLTLHPLICHPDIAATHWLPGADGHSPIGGARLPPSLCPHRDAGVAPLRRARVLQIRFRGAQAKGTDTTPALRTLSPPPESRQKLIPGPIRACLQAIVAEDLAAQSAQLNSYIWDFAVALWRQRLFTPTQDPTTGKPGFKETLGLSECAPPLLSQRSCVATDTHTGTLWWGDDTPVQWSSN
jgi:hypothetical protein